MRVLGLLGVFGLAAGSFGDSFVAVHVEITGPTARSVTNPLVGDYGFAFSNHRASVQSPNGKVFGFDFEKKSFSSVNPAQKTFYETDIADVLGVGDKVRPGNRVDGSSKLSQNTFAGASPNLDRPAKPYQVSLESILSMTSGNPVGVGFGYTTRGGLQVSGANGAEKSMVTMRRKLEGRLWLGDAPTGLDRDEFNTAFECVLLWGAPQGDGDAAAGSGQSADVDNLRRVFGAPLRQLVLSSASLSLSL